MFQWLRKKMGLEHISQDLAGVKGYTNHAVRETRIELEKQIKDCQDDINSYQSKMTKEFQGVVEQLRKMCTIGVSLEDFKYGGANWGVILINNPRNQRVELFNIKRMEDVEHIFKVLKHTESIVDVPRSIESLMYEIRREV